MLGRTYEGENCSAARTLEVVGERWSLLIIRDALFRGTTRFTDFQRALGVATNVLTTRLEGFVAAGLMDRIRSAPPSVEYVLTAKGRDLLPTLVALTEWGDRWAAPEGPPIVFAHDGCGGEARQHIQCAECAAPLSGTAVVAQPGPGLATTAAVSTGLTQVIR